jgi:cellulose synthase/poly-beta-1,6-N-acetylglucosamine synthase-like glycosyltransferase
LSTVQPGEQIEQDEYYSTPDIYPSNGAQQFRAPLTPRLNGQPGEQIQQDECYSAPGVPPSNGSSPLKVPTTPFSSVQVTPKPGIPAIPAPGIPAIVDPRIQQQVKDYADWLAKQAKYDILNDNTQEINDYIQEATKVVKVGEKEVTMFAPFRPKHSALQTFTARQVVALCVIGLLWMIGLLVFRLEMLTAVIAAITVLYFCTLVLNVSLAIRSFRNSPEERISDDIVHALKNANWPLYTILCPLYREVQVVPQFVQAMLALDYPPENLQILFLTEADDAETNNAIRALALPPHFKILVVPEGQPRTKPRACNYGLMHAKGPYVVIYDAEDIPDPLQLKKAVLTFANHWTDVVCVQAKLNIYNTRQNLLTRWFTAEYSAWFDLILPGLQLARFPLPLGGTSNHFRASVLRALGGWDAYNVTEDCDLGLRLKGYRMNTIILDSTTLEEANSQLKNWLRQRSRWIKGYLQTYLVHMRNPLESLQKGRLYDLFSFQMVIGSGTSVMFINPLMWVVLGLYIALGHSVINVYHLLFPGPILYLGVFCLIFGNFFYVYLYLLACMKRKQYHLLPWTLFIPIYWLLMSMAALYALFELLVKPHYWQKTVHGLHLKGKQAAPALTSRAGALSMVEEQMMPVPVMAGKVSKVGSIPSVTMSLKAIPTLLMPAIPPEGKQAQRVARRSKVKDLWLVATIVTACITSIVACLYYFQQHEILLYEDAYSHLRISRSVFDNITPGIAQLGTVWLPLPHVLIWPFIWNDYLWHSGLAGSLVSMPCYVIAAIYLFLSARRLTGNSSASFIGTLAFIFNPNILYLQSTPLSETVCIAALMMTGYYFIAWIQEGSLNYLIFTAGCTFLATLARYDGWALFLALLCLIPLVGLMKRQRLAQIGGNLIVFGVLGGFGIGLWFAWNKIIFGDPLFFQRGVYSSQAQQSIVLQRNQLYSYHNLWQAIRFYTIDFGQSVGPILCLLAAVGLIWFVIRHRFTPSTLGALVFLVPFAFYVAALYGGQAIIWLPAANPPDAPYYVFLYNVRYGAQMVAPVAFFIALLVGNLSPLKLTHFVKMGTLIFVAVILLQSFWTTSQGILSLQDGQYNYSCFARQNVNQFLAEHYNGGRILEDFYAVGFDSSKIGIDFKNIIYEGSGPYWLQALHDPADSVDWIVVKPDSNIDLVAHSIDLNSPLFLSQFTLVAKQDNNVYLYHRLGRPPLPTRYVPYLQVDHQPCRKP